MKIVRYSAGILAGYAVFVVSAVLLFRLAGVDPHRDPSMAFMMVTFAYGTAFAFLGGIVAQLISGSGELKVNYILAGIIAGFAVFSLFKTTGNHYSQLGAIFLFAPAALLAGVVFLRKQKSTRPETPEKQNH